MGTGLAGWHRGTGDQPNLDMEALSTSLPPKLAQESPALLLRYLLCVARAIAIWLSRWTLSTSGYAIAYILYLSLL